MAMSTTEYSRKHQLKLDDWDQKTLATLVMREITARSTAMQTMDGELLTEARRYVARLRSLLERLGN